MSSGTSSLANWTPEQIAQAKKWVETWRLAGPELEKLRREELRVLDVKKTIRLLCGPANYRVAPRAPKPTTGLIEQQYWFMKVRSRV